jgi:hypothetical protein
LFVDVLETELHQFGYLLSLSSLLVLAGAVDYFGGGGFRIGLVGFGVTSLL